MGPIDGSESIICATCAGLVRTMSVIRCFTGSGGAPPYPTSAAICWRPGVGAGPATAGACGPGGAACGPGATCGPGTVGEGAGVEGRACGPTAGGAVGGSVGRTNGKSVTAGPV